MERLFSDQEAGGEDTVVDTQLRDEEMLAAERVEATIRDRVEVVHDTRSSDTALGPCATPPVSKRMSRLFHVGQLTERGAEPHRLDAEREVYLRFKHRVRQPARLS